MRLIVSQEAANDLEDLALYIAEYDIAAALAVVDEIEHRFNTIQRHPDIGRARDELASGLRSYTVKQHLIFYTHDDQAVVIVRVMNGAQDINPVDIPSSLL